MIDNNIIEINYTKISTDLNNENTSTIDNIVIYLQTQKTTAEILLLPSFFYILVLSFILHHAICNPPLTRQIKIQISEKKKYLLIFHISIHFYNILYLFNYSPFISKNSFCISTIFNFILIICFSFTNLFITEQNYKMIQVPYKNPILFFFIMCLFNTIIRFISELFNGILFSSITLNIPKIFIDIYTVQYFYRHKTNEYTGTVIDFVELPEIKSSSSLIVPLKQHIKEDTASIVTELPLIEVSFKNSFQIKMNEDIGEDNLVNFYSKILFVFTVNVNSVYYKSNHQMKKSLRDFFNLESKLHSEFLNDHYDSYLKNNVPNLYISKDICYSNIDIIEKIKGKLEIFLKETIKEPGYINKDVLNFLGVDNEMVKLQFENHRGKYTISEKTKISFYNSLTRSISINNVEKGIRKNLKIKIIEGSYVKDKRYSSWKDNKEVYEFRFKITCNNAYKIIKKNINDVKLLIDELSRMNNRKYDDEYNEMLNEFMQVYMQLNGKYQTFYSFKLQWNPNVNRLTIIIEKIIQRICDNFAVFQGFKNMIINDFFSEFQDDFSYSNKEKTDEDSLIQKSENDNLSKFETLLQENLILNIEMIATNYIFISVDYKCRVFYNICFKIVSTSQDFVNINKKYKFKEIQRYIDLIRNELEMTNTWPNECFVNKGEDTEFKYKIRLKYIKNYLHLIANNKNFFKTKNWKQVFYMDVSFKQSSKSTTSSLPQTPPISRKDSMFINLMSNY